MAKLKYIGSSHFRELAKSDFTRHDGVEGEAIKLARHDIFPEQNNKGYKTVAEVSQETADWLMENEPGDWALVEDKDEEPADTGDGDESSAPDASGAPSGSPDAASRTSQAGKKASSTRPH